MAKANAVWGIDIGQCALKALRCTLGADGVTIVADKFDFIEYPKILSQPEADPEELIQEALTQFLSRNSVIGDKVAICVSGQAGLSRFFKPPPVEVSTLPDIVKYEVKQQIPFPIEDVIWDWQQLGGTVVDGRAIDAEVGLFAMKRDAVFRALRPFDDVDVEIDIVQLSPLSVFNVVCHDMLGELPNAEDYDSENPPASIVVMAIGTDTTDLVVTNGMKLWLRNIPIGGNHFTRQLSRELKLTQTKAEHLKRNARQSENPKAVFKAMRPVFNDLVNEVQRSLTFFQSMEKTAKISEIVLLGNAAKLPGLRQFLNTQLEIDIAKSSEFKKLEGNEVIKQPTFTNNLLSYAPCYGLCIQGLKKAKINTNLLPQEIVIERVVRAKKPWVLASVGALMLGMVVGLYFIADGWWKVNENYTDAGNSTWKDAIQNVKTESTKSGGFVATDADLKLKLANFNLIGKELSSASESKATWLDIYSALWQALPKDERIEAELADGQIAVDPAKVGFKDRKELYIDHVESVYYQDLSVWDKQIDPIFKNMILVDEPILKEMLRKSSEAIQTDVAAEATAEGEAPTGASIFEGKSGWVIEIRAHHFHNSDAQVMALMSDKTFVLKEFIQKLIAKQDVKLPMPNGSEELFSFADIGIFKPTITKASQRELLKIEFDPTNTGPAASGAPGLGGRLDFGAAGGEGEGNDRGNTASTGDAEKNSQDVHVFNFVVQMAWIPRSPQERLDARQARLDAEKIAADAAAAAAALQGATEGSETE